MHAKKTLSYAALATIFAVAGCTPDLNTLEKTTPTGGDAFTEALAEDYKILAEENKERGVSSYQDADMFARKGLGAAGGEMVQPIDPIKMEGIPANKIQELAQARAALAELFANGVDRSLPDLMAAAQVNFDCWVDEVSEGDNEAAGQCKADFDEALIRIHDALSVHPELFLVFFNYGSSKIDPAGMEVLGAAAATFRDTGANEILVLGYTDLTGSAAANIRVSQQRANATKNALIAMGVPADRIVALGQGESNPLVDTNKADRENRRVEIIIR